jgi:hypothetical protein
MLHKAANKTAPNRIFFPVGDIAHNRLTAMTGDRLLKGAADWRTFSFAL